MEDMLTPSLPDQVSMGIRITCSYACQFLHLAKIAKALIVAKVTNIAKWTVVAEISDYL
jgi:hypothetical protein